jgi:RNA-binding protein Musashi
VVGTGAVDPTVGGGDGLVEGMLGGTRDGATAMGGTGGVGAVGTDDDPGGVGDGATRPGTRTGGVEGAGLAMIGPVADGGGGVRGGAAAGAGAAGVARGTEGAEMGGAAESALGGEIAPD